MGPPGAGKGTQAKVVAEHFGVPAISTGDIFRFNVSEGTELGRKAKEYMDAGEYVPDEITNLMVRNRIDERDAEPGFLLDGYPRTLSQVEELDGMIKFTGHELDAVVVLTVDEEELVQRLLARAETDGRSDDTEDVIRRRQEVYAEQTEPLIDVYRDRNLLIEVDGMGEVDEVTKRIFDAARGRPPELSPGHGRWASATVGSRSRPRADPQDAGRGAARGGDPRAAARVGRVPASPPETSTRSRRRTSATAAGCRPSSATVTRRSRPPSARRSTTRWCTASRATGC